MTFAVGHVEGGTHAGWRRVKEKAKAWVCDCHDFPANPQTFRHIKPGYLTRCPVCRKKRP